MILDISRKAQQQPQIPGKVFDATFLPTEKRDDSIRLQSQKVETYCWP